MVSSVRVTNIDLNNLLLRLPIAIFEDKNVTKSDSDKGHGSSGCIVRIRIQTAGTAAFRLAWVSLQRQQILQGVKKQTEV